MCVCLLDLTGKLGLLACMRLACVRLVRDHKAVLCGWRVQAAAVLSAELVFGVLLQLCGCCSSNRPLWKRAAISNAGARLRQLNQQMWQAAHCTGTSDGIAMSTAGSQLHSADPTMCLGDVFEQMPPSALQPFGHQAVAHPLNRASLPDRPWHGRCAACWTGCVELLRDAGWVGSCYEGVGCHQLSCCRCQGCFLYLLGRRRLVDWGIYGVGTVC
jgi:hypothetical protein